MPRNDYFGSMLSRRVSRRDFLARTAAFGVGVSAIGGFLAACGGEEGTGATPSPGKPSGDITLSSWGGDFSKAWKQGVAGPFTAASGINVIFDDAPGEHVAKLQAQKNAGHIQWDLVDFYIFDYMAADKLGFVQPLPSDLKATLEKVSLPGFVSSGGIISIAAVDQVIAYNTDTLDKHPTTPADFFDTKGFPGRRAMYGDGYFDNVATALLADGLTWDNLFPLDLDRAYRKLDGIRKDVAVWYTTGDQQQQILRDGEVDMLFGWDGRLYNLRDEGTVKLGLSFEGSILAPNYLTVVTDAPNQQGAFEFVKFFGTNPQAQAGLSDGTGYPTPNPESTQFVDADVRSRLWTASADSKSKVNLFNVDTFPEDPTLLSKRWYDWFGG